MSNRNTRPFSPGVQALIDEFVPIIKKWDTGRYAISIGGSLGKGTGDSRSDVDFRLFHEKPLPRPQDDPVVWAEFNAAMERWRQKGLIVDGIWRRKIADMDAALDRWLGGDIKPDDRVWTIWGYHLLPDLYHQAIVEDPYGVILGWKQRLQHYPPSLKQAVLGKHWASLQYWRNDYHYANKVRRGDVVFLAGLSARLVHDMMQVLFALNETYYVGDGQNLDFAQAFPRRPADLAEHVRAILYPPPSERLFEAQREAIIALIDDIAPLVAQAQDGLS